MFSLGRNPNDDDPRRTRAEEEGDVKTRIGPAVVVALVAATVLAMPAAKTPVRASTLSPQVALDWNLNAVTAVRGATVPLPKFQAEGMIHMSYVQAAVYDAVTKIEGRYEPYHHFKVSHGIDVHHASPDAAVIQATYSTLAHYLSDQPATLLDPLKAKYDAAVAALPAAGKSDGLAVGLAAANDIIKFRAHDGLADPSVTFTPGPPGPGVYQFAPAPSLQFAQTPWVASFTPFLLKSPSQFRPDGPPHLSSHRWAEAFNEVKAYGGATGSLRSPDQTATAWFWTANVVSQYNQAFRDLAVAHGFDLVDTVRALAMANMMGADALIGCFDGKYHFAFWRPVTAIRSADTDGNSETSSDPTWAPLLVTPNHPEYPSAHGSITGAEADVFAALLGTKHIEVNIVGFNPADGLTDLTRHFETTSDLRHEVVDARTWGGLHYRFSTVRGEDMGHRTAKWALERYFLPVDRD